MSMKRLLLLVTIVLVAGCGSHVEIPEDRRFKPTNNVSVEVLTDNVTGCMYISRALYSSWTYVHGSCPDVIANERVNDKAQ